MSISLVQSTESTPTTYSVTETLASNTTAGNTLIAAMCDWPSSSSTTFSGPTGFTLTTNAPDYGAGFNQVNMAYLYSTNIAGGQSSYTFTGSGGYAWVGLAEFSGVTIYGIDWNIPYQPSTSDLTYTMTGNTPSVSGELIIAGAFTAAGDALSFTTPTGWNLLAELPNGSSTGNTRGAVYWQVAGTTAPSCAFNWNSTSDDMSFMMIAYLTAAPAPPSNMATSWMLT